MGRFNYHTRKHLDRLRHEIVHIHRGSGKNEKIHTIPRGAIAMHVRHGVTKQDEMSHYFSINHFSAQAERLAMGDQNIIVLEPRFQGNKYHHDMGFIEPPPSFRTFKYSATAFAHR